MSVEKVNQYKDKKYGVAKETKEAKIAKIKRKLMGWGAAALLGGGLCLAIGLTAYDRYDAYMDSIPDYTRTDMVVSDMTGILDETEAAE